ncbi:hypothetical protein FraQA3DRAFT_5902, partial [Frankia sp. QA3]
MAGLGEAAAEVPARPAAADPAGDVAEVTVGEPAWVTAARGVPPVRP